MSTLPKHYSKLIMAQAQIPLPTNFSPPPPLKLKDNKADEWKLFCQLWDNYVVITDLETKDKAFQRAVFLNTAGAEGVRLFNSLTFDTLPDGEKEDDKDVTLIMKKMATLILGEKNETYERYVFNKRDQGNDETIDAYVVALTELVKTCNFCDCLRQSLIRDRLVLGIKDQHTRKVLLQKKDLTLSTAIDICRSAEATTSQLKELGEDPTVHAIRRKPREKNTERRRASRPTGTNMIRCKFCGKTHIRRKEECPAYGRTCKVCGKRNHFAKCCMTRKHSTHAVTDMDSVSTSETDSESIDCVEQINAANNKKSALYAEMLLDEKSVKFQIDSGATVNVIPRKYVSTTIDEPKVQLKMYNGTTLWAKGRAKLKMRNPKNRKKYKVTFVVIDEENFTPLLSRKAAEQMKLITVNYDNFNLLHSLIAKDELLNEFAEVFDDKQPGKLPGTTHLVIDAEGVKPTQCNAKPIPVALKQRAKDGLDELVRQEILAPVDKPTDWCSRLVITEKKNTDELRFCIDPRPLNKVLQREVHRLPVIEDILPELSKAKIFSKLDLKSGYLHCELDEESSYLTTMNTPFGRYRWKRLPFGLKVSSEIFQKRLQQALAGLEGTECVADDIIIFGVGNSKEEAEKSHDQRLRALLQRCKDIGIRLNRSKSVFRTTSVTFLGHVVTEQGLGPDPQKIEAITNLPNPTDATEVQRLQGSVQYLARFLPRLSEIFEPLRRLTHKGTPWQWGHDQEKAMREVKQLLTTAPILSFYNPEKELTIQCDASKSGLGTTLLQEGHPVAYASRALTKTEQRYAQIEKEALAIVFSLDRFHQYTFGRHVRIQTDHKPLETIVKKPLHRAPRRLQGMLMRMLHYDIEVTWIKGKDMHLADLLSRAYLPDTAGANDFDEVNMVTGPSMSEDRIKELKTHTHHDNYLQVLKSVIIQGWPDNKSQVEDEAKPYFHIRDELSCQDGLLYRGERIVIPVSMRKQMKEMLHTSHLGVESTLRRARECMYWPGMNSDIKIYISACDACRTYERQNQKETLQSHDVPDRPWEKIGVDLFELDKKHYLITVDYFSNFWEIDRLHELTAPMVIKKLKGHFARYGIPNTVITDNGPQFTSEEFVNFRRKWDFDHLTISPRHSQSNGKAESAVKAAKRMLKKCKKSHTDPYAALMEIRNTPQQGIDSSPAQRLHGRRTRTTLPTTSNLLQPRGTETLKEEKRKLKTQQRRQAKTYNRNAKDLTILQKGDSVRLKPYKQSCTEWEKAVVKRRLDQRSYEIETEKGLRLRRNRRDLKRTSEVPKQHTPHKQKQHHNETHTQARKPAKKRLQHDLQEETSQHNGAKTKRPQNKEETKHTTKETRSGRKIKTPAKFKDYIVG